MEPTFSYLIQLKPWNIIIQLLNQAVNQLKNRTKAAVTKPSKYGITQ
jgi:hypothetical protein